MKKAFLLILLAYYRNSPIIAGYDATTSETFGDVIIKDGAKMDIKVGSGGVTLKNGFECQIGDSLVVEQLKTLVIQNIFLNNFAYNYYYRIVCKQ